MATRLPPANVEAEASVLGALLIDQDAINKLGFLKPGHFYREAHATIFEAMQSLASSQTAIDFITLGAELERHGQLAEVGGDAYITGLMADVPSSLHAEHYARLVVRAANQRRLIALATSIAQWAYDQQEPSDMIEHAQARLLEVADEAQQGKQSWSAAETASYSYTLMEKRRHDWQSTTKGAYPVTPWPVLAEFIPWLKPGLPAIVAGGTSSGKTLFCENLAEAWAQQGWNVAFFHYELPTDHMIDRRLCRHGRVAMKAMEQGQAFAVLDDVRDWIETWPGNIQYIHSVGWPMTRLVSEAEALRRAGLCDIVIVDYLQKIPFVAHVKGMTTAQMAGYDVNLLKNFCEKRGTAAVLVSQYNNAGDLRNTGEYRQFVNIVIELNKMDDRVLAVKVTKNTSGRTGEARISIDLEHFRITDVARECR